MLLMKYSKHILIPSIIFIAVLGVGRLAYQYVTAQEQAKLGIRIQITAEQVGIRLNEFLNTRLTRLDFFRERMEHKPALSEAEFRSRALLVQHELPGFQAINWVDSHGIIQWVTPLSTNLPAVGVDLVEKAAKGAAEVFLRSHRYQIDTATPLIKLIQGGNGFANYLPIVIDDEIVGFINGVFRIEELMTHFFGNSIRDFNYEVVLSGERVFLRGESKNFENPTVLGRHNFTLLGQSWEIQIVPGSTDKDTAKFMHLLSQAITIILGMILMAFIYFKMKSSAELKEAHKIVEDSESKFRTIFEKSPACLLRYGSRGKITDWNLEAASLFGFEFPPQHDRDFYEMPELEPLLPAIERTLKGKDSEFVGFLEIQGRAIEVDAAFEALLTTTDQSQGGLVLLKDVTEQKRTSRAKEVMYEIGDLTNRIKDLPELFKAIQKSLSRILDTRNFYVALYNAETDEFYYPYYSDEFDSAPPEPQKGEKGISAYVVKNAVPILLSRDEFYTMNAEGKIDLLGTPSEQWLGCPLIVEDKPIGIMAVQSYSKDVVFDGSDMGMLNFVSDQVAITIKINIEDEKLRKSEAMHRELSVQLSDSNNIKALLLDILSHDLKNPAGVISSVAEILSMEENASEEVKLIKDSSDALLKVIENTTALARITLGEAIALDEIDVSEIAQQVADEFKPSFDASNKQLDIRIAPSLIYKANPIISEVFRNYLSNALKYAPEDQPVAVHLKQTEDAIEFFVEDLGVSIPKEDQELIFHRSVQLENGKMRGSGLGLAIVKRIAEVHGASVGVTAGDPAGNIFYMNLPTKENSEMQNKGLE